MNRHVQLGLLITLLVVCCYLEIPAVDFSTKNEESQVLSGLSQLPLIDKKSSTMEGEERLSKSVIHRVKTFVFFLGHARSGHSIVGSLMDSHPHMVISHEFDLFKRLSSGSLAPTKSQIFNSLWINSKHSITTGIRTNSVNSKGYTLFMDGLYQGRYVDHIDVIGNKQGGVTTGILRKWPERWLTAFNILKSLNVTLKVILALRNPYDNIATAVLYKSDLHQSFGTVKQSNETYEVDSVVIKGRIEVYFSYHQAIVNAMKAYDLDIIEIHSKDLISDPIGTLLKICNGVGVTCSDEYLEICSKKIFRSESRTRHKIKWTDKQLQKIQENIEKYSYLKRYSFDS